MSERVAEVARPVMHHLSKKSIWLTNLMLFDRDAMLVREVTTFRAHVIVDRIMPGMRVPIVFTASGGAFLFACTEERRQEIIALIAKKNDEEGVLARDAHKLDELKRQTGTFGSIRNRSTNYVRGPRHGSDQYALSRRGTPDHGRY